MRLLALLSIAACGSKPLTDAAALPDADADGSPDDEDCDDVNPLVRPGIAEACDGLDSDCDPATGEAGIASVNGTSGSDVQVVLDAAVSGDEVAVCEGTYAGGWSVPSGVTVRGVAGSAVTVVEGPASGTAITAADGAIEGITVTGAFRGLDVAGGAGLSLTDVVINGCAADGEDGGGMRIGANATVTLAASTVSGNSATRGGGAALMAGASLTLTESFVEANTATALGGGLLVEAGGAVSGGTVRENTAPVGGGLALLGDAAISTILVSRNIAVAAGTTTGGFVPLGGGLHVTGPGPVVLTDAVITANAADPGYGTAGEGGGIYADGTALTFAGTTTITLNVAVSGGGAALHGDASITGGQIVANIAVVEGGGLYTVGDVQLSDLTISTNGATVGGAGLSVKVGSVTGDAVVFDGNVAGLGGGLSLQASTVVVLTGGAITTNEANLGGGGVVMFGVAADASTFDCVDTDLGADVSDNLPDDIQAGSSIRRDGLATLACIADRGCR